MKNVVVVDKNGNALNYGDTVVIRINNLKNFPDYYHLGYYKVNLNPYFGMELVFQDLVTGQTDNTNQYIGVTFFDRKDIEFYPVHFGSDTEVAKYTFVIKGKNALVEFEFTDDIERV